MFQSDGRKRPAGRRRKGPRLYLRPARKFREASYVILDGADEVSTGCGAEDLPGAERALATYLMSKYAPPRQSGGDLTDIAIADVMLAYMREHAPELSLKSREFISVTAEPIIEWWGGKTLNEVKGQSCRDYVAWRVAQPIKSSVRPKKDGTLPEVRYPTVATARHDLKTMRAAINHWHREHGPLPSVPTVTLPEPPPPRGRWLTRDEAARMIFAAHRTRQVSHVARVILIGVYTGTRSGALLGLRWSNSNSDEGWIDLDNAVIYRKGPNARQTKKRQPPIRIPDQLAPHLRRWYKQDVTDREKAGLPPTQYVIHYGGERILKLRRSFETVLKAAGLEDTITPHILRHTATTWLMQGGCNVYEAAGFLGMSIDVLTSVYGHHHPDHQAEAVSAQRGRKPRIKR